MDYIFYIDHIMDLIIADEIGFYFGTSRIFSNISLTITDQTRLALVGKNGLGKTTILRVIAGELETTEGEVFRNKGLRIGFLRQEQRLEGKMLLVDSVLAQNKRWWELKLRLDSDFEEPNEYEELMNEFIYLGGYAKKNKCEEVLSKLGFDESVFYQPVDTLSGGERNRAAIAAVLLQDPDIMFFDEPTNHIDYDGLVWMAEFLRSTRLPYVLVSHDRYFLNLVADKIIELDQDGIVVYHGNYDKYEIQRIQYLNRKMKTFKHQQEYIKKTEEFIRRNLAGQKTKQAQSRRKKLEKFDRISSPTFDHGFRIKLKIKQRSGNRVLSIQGLSHSYGKKTLFKDFETLLGRGDRIGVVGRNGCGKSTLLKLITGVIPIQNGIIELGTNAAPGYYTQEFDDLDNDSTPFDTISYYIPGAEDEQVRTFLGAFSISADDVFRRIGTFSGGERSRVALAKLALLGSNFLLLDEPTNHLDINSRRILEDAFAAFPGTMIVVSHDRIFLDKTINKIWAFENGYINEYSGNFSYFLEKRKQRKLGISDLQKVYKKKSPKTVNELRFAKNRYNRLRNEISEIEIELENLETERDNIIQLMGQTFVAKNAVRIKKLSKESSKLDSKMKFLWDEWEKISEELDNLTKILKS